MQTSRIIVRLDKAKNAAELEIKTPHNLPRLQGLEQALRQIGVRALHTVEISTRSHCITRTKVVESNGARLESTRVLEILSAAQAQRPRYLPRSTNVA